MTIPKLEPMYCRNAHILYSAQIDYMGPTHHRKNVVMFNADEKGNLYIMGRLERIWFHFTSLFLGRYQKREELNCRVNQAIKKTVKAIEDHFDRLSQFWDTYDVILRHDSDLLKNFNQQLYVFPKRHRVEKVNWESLFFLDLEKINSLDWEINLRRPHTYPLGNRKQTITLRKKYVQLEERITKINPSLDFIHILNLVDFSDAFEVMKTHFKTFDLGMMDL